MLNKIRIALVGVALLSALMVTAYNIKGVVADTGGEPMPEATIRLLAARDSAFVKGVIADLDGKFRFADVKKGKYILETSYTGYEKNMRDIAVTGNLDVDTIVLSESSYMLKETTVIGVKTPIKVMQDTIEYNADSYKTQPNAVVEDLLKRLPGVDVDSDGKITANGKEVTKILVDGKEFFSDDPKVASKNLPVNMVDKLQVVDRKSDLARLTGVDDGEDETVINLTVKKGMQNGWFGTVEAGYGTDNRYKGTFNVNRFWDGNQITFIGNANNTNELGFTDGNGNRFRRFGGDNGINNSQSFGVNFNVGREEIIRFGGDVMYSHTDRDTRTRQNRQFLFPDSTSYENSRTTARDRGHNVRADFRVEWKPDSFNIVDFRPSFSYNQNLSDSESTDNLIDGLLRPVNNSKNTSGADGKSYEASGRLIYTHNFNRRRGRSFSFMVNYSMSNVREFDNSFSYNYFNMLKDVCGNDSVDSYYELADNHTWNNNVSGRVSWVEPIGDASKGRFITFSYRAQYRWNNADKIVSRSAMVNNVYDQVSGAYLPFDAENIQYQPWEQVDSLSNRFRNDFFTQSLRLGFKLVKKAYNLEAGFSVVPSMSKSENLINDAKSIPERWVWNFAPFARLNYKFNKQTSLNFNYNGRSQQPSMTQLQPVADYSNPLNVKIGNPNLVPTFTHYIRTRFQMFQPESQRSIMAMLDAEVAQNSIISRTKYDNLSGGRVTTYENVNGVFNIRLMNMFSQPFGHTKLWSFNNHMFVMYNRRVGYNNNDINQSGTLMFNESPSIAFRPSNLELELRPFYRLQATYNSLPNVRTSTIHNYGGSFNGTYYTPWNIVLNTDLTYTASTGYSAGYNQNTLMWNAAISYQALRDKSLTITLKGYDLLQQKLNVRRSVTANYIDDTEYNSLTRYFMLSVTWKFNSFGKGNEPADRNMMQRWGPPGGGPGGPPRR